LIIKNFEVGDRVEATSGQCKGIKGQVLEIDNPALVTVRTLDKSSLNIKIWTKDLQKYFEKGEMIRIMSGVHAGGSGTITAILDKHAIVAMEGTRHELKILMSNLKIKRDEMDHVVVKMDGLVKKTNSI